MLGDSLHQRTHLWEEEVEALDELELGCAEHLATRCEAAQCCSTHVVRQSTHAG